LGGTDDVSRHQRVRSRSFRFVVIDEAFGRGSDESAQYGLRLFAQLSLQLLIVTPLQKIHIIEPFVSSVGFVQNDDGRAPHRSPRLVTLTSSAYLASKSPNVLSCQRFIGCRFTLSCYDVALDLSRSLLSLNLGRKGRRFAYAKTRNLRLPNRTDFANSRHFVNCLVNIRKTKPNQTKRKIWKLRGAKWKRKSRQINDSSAFSGVT
jgi:hypothetical protein